jgi:hypothetical protein
MTLRSWIAHPPHREVPLYLIAHFIQGKNQSLRKIGGFKARILHSLEYL